MKTTLFAALAATAMFTAIASSASAGQYSRWALNHYTAGRLRGVTGFKRTLLFLSAKSHLSIG